MIDKIEESLIFKLVLGEITEKDFLNQYPVDLNKNTNYFIDLVNESIKNQDSDCLSISLDAMAGLSVYKDYDLQSLYKKMIRENWHEIHEELIDSLDVIESNEDCYIYVLNQVYDYYKDGIEDFMVPIWSKCLWALYRIKSKKAINAINNCSNSEYEYIRLTSKELLLKLENENNI